MEAALDETLANIGTDYLDLYLIHWPIHLNPNGNHPTFPTLPDGKRDVLYDWKMKDTWAQLEAVLKKGTCRWCAYANVRSDCV